MLAIQHHAYGKLFMLCAWLAFAPTPLLAQKVSLEPSNWKHPGGAQCIACHQQNSPQLVKEWQDSAHGKAGVNCMDCHQANKEENDAYPHQDHVIATLVTPTDCGRCHEQEVFQHQNSTHAKATQVLLERGDSAGFHLDGKETRAICENCHGNQIKLINKNYKLDPATWPNNGIGRINPDGSAGSCSACHNRHGFSKAQAREPAACAPCHNGDESPDAEVYAASAHGSQYSAVRDQMNLKSDAWVAGSDYRATPTCVTCHMGAGPDIQATHDVGIRSVWQLNAPISEKHRLVVLESGDKVNLPKGAMAAKSIKKGEEIPPSVANPPPSVPTDMLSAPPSNIVAAVAEPERRREAMLKICSACHLKPAAEKAMRQFDELVELYNDQYGKPAQAIMQALYKENKLTPRLYDEPLEFTYRALWHDSARKARHGAAMQSHEYARSGMYEVSEKFYGQFLPQMRAVAGEELAERLLQEHVYKNPGHKWLTQDTEAAVKSDKPKAENGAAKPAKKDHGTKKDSAEAKPVEMPTEEATADVKPAATPAEPADEAKPSEPQKETAAEAKPAEASKESAEAKPAETPTEPAADTPQATPQDGDSAGQTGGDNPK